MPDGATTPGRQVQERAAVQQWTVQRPGLGRGVLPYKAVHPPSTLIVVPVI